LNVQLVTSYEDFTKLEPRWSEIAKAGRGQTPFQSFAWIDLWLRYRGKGIELFFLLLQDGATIAPFGRWRTAGARILRLVGTGDSDYTGLVTALPPDQAWNSVAQEIARRCNTWDLLHLHSVRERDAILSALARHIGANCFDRPYEVCPLVLTNRSWDGLLAGRRKLKYEIKRWTRRLEELGAVKVEVVRPPVTDTLLSELLEVERASWKWEMGNAVFQPGSQRDFLRGVLQDPRTQAEVWLLRVSNRLVGFDLILTAETRWYLYISMFRKDCGNAGSYLLARVIQRACSSGCECVDLLQGDEEYKYAWTDLNSQVFEIVCPSNLRGRIMTTGYRARWHAAKNPFLHRLRARLTRQGDRR